MPGVLVDEAVERVAPQDQRLDPIDRDRRRGPGGAVEQRELAEEPTRPDDGQDGRLAAVLGRDQDLDRPARHDEQGVAGIAAVEDRLATSEATRAQGADHEVQPRLVQAGEQPAGHERLADERVVGRAGHHVAIVRARGAVR